MTEYSKQSRRSFIMNSAGAAASMMIPGFIKTPVFGNFSETLHFSQVSGIGPLMLTGFAEMDITPEIGMEQPGGYGKAYHKTFHDPCKVRAVVVDDGVKKLALVGIDALIIRGPLVKNVRKQINERCGIPDEGVLIGASHSHSSGPTGMILPGEFDHASTFVRSLAYEKSSCADPKYLEYVEKQIVEAVCLADKSRTETTLGIGRGYEDKVVFNRRFRMKNGMSISHPGQLNPDIIEPAGPIDPEVGVIGVWNKQGNCIGCIVNYACHATTNPGGISANWIYYLEQTIRGAMGSGCVVVFLQGACGDVTQVDNRNPYLNRAGEDWARFVGSRVGAETIKILLSMPRGTLMPLDARLRVMDMNHRIPDPERVKKCYELVNQPPEKIGTTEWTFAKEIVLLDSRLKKGIKSRVEVQSLQLGPAVFLANPAELFCQLGIDMKNQSPFKYTFPVELANDCVGYVPTEEAFGPHGGGYETRLTSYSNLEPQAGKMIVDASVGLAKQMIPGKEPEFPTAKPYSGNPWSYGNVKPELK